MKTQKDFLQALLDGKTLINRENGVEVKMDVERGYVVTGARDTYFAFFDRYTQFDIKPSTLLIGDELIVLPEPIHKEPSVGTAYWAIEHEPDSAEISVVGLEWADDEVDNEHYNNGVIFENEERAVAMLDIVYKYLIHISVKK